MEQEFSMLRLDTHQRDSLPQQTFASNNNLMNPEEEEESSLMTRSTSVQL